MASARDNRMVEESRRNERGQLISPTIFHHAMYWPRLQILFLNTLSRFILALRGFI
ncbi:MAG TPA: hypothetical protein PKD79_01100 [Candidatus Doudnabacteria bacterium]|nr:hypothetical protein [Candidatus Doudnabacteria bacterium]